jgi:uridylate kinase
MALYKRVVLKLSGEALAGDRGFGITPEAMQLIGDEIIKLHHTGTQIAIVLGGGKDRKSVV